VFDTGPPLFPFAGLATLIDLFPAVATSLARILAVTCPLLTKLVVRIEPLNSTVAPDKNPLPLTVSVKDPLPTATLDGDRLLMVGPDGPEPGPTVKERPFDVPAGVVTTAT